MAPVTDGDETTNEDSPSLAKNRSRRTKIDKTGRLATLAKLKKSKETGERLKFDVKEEEDVYEDVDEEEYSRIVRDRQQDDWIVDDDGCGYVEDGREIFDEEGGDNENQDKMSKKVKKKSKNPNIRAPGSNPKSIKSMFAAAAVKPSKKTANEVRLNDDELLGDLINELHKGSSQSAPAPIKLKKKTPKANPFASTTPTRSPAMKPAAPRNIAMSPSIPPRKQMVKRRVDDSEKYSLNVEQESMEIEDFPSQNNQEKQVLKESQNIEECSESQDVDVSGIDFTDDFDDEDDSEEAKKESKSVSKVATDHVKPSVQQSSKMPEISNVSSWEMVKGDQSEAAIDVQVDSTKLPLTTGEDGEQVLRFFWLDMYEDAYKQPGVLYLFGKVWIESAKTHVSCCVSVRNVERRILLLPRKYHLDPKTQQETEKEVTFVDLYNEFNDAVADKYKIMKFKTMKTVRCYAFEKQEVPEESEYLEVRYPAEYPALPENLHGNTFSHVFGSHTSCTENFLLQRKIKGPCWLDIKMPQIPNPGISWCKVEAYVSKAMYVSPCNQALAPPPLVIMAINLRTMPNPKTHQNEVIAVAGLVHQQFAVDKPAPKQLFQQHFCAASKPSDFVFPYDFQAKMAKKADKMKIEAPGSERALLAYLLAKINKIDPDVIIGHDVVGFDLDVILQRISHNKIPHWSRIGRLKKATMPKLGVSKGSSSSATSGRLVCDIKISAKELIRCRSYDLTELTKDILKGERQEIDPEVISSCFNTSDHLLTMLELTLMDATYILRLMYELNVLPLALQITNICGNIMSRTLLGGRSERNEYLLLHAFTERGFIVPDKSYSKKAALVAPADPDEEGDVSMTTSGRNKSTRRKPAYSGGLVLEPKKGFYDQCILLLDFNSLYPSIIQEYNICFTTISRNDKSQDAEEDWNLDLPEPDLDPGVLPTEIRKLVQSRRQVKQLMKNPDLSPDMLMQYDIRQKALKLTANSMYGCLGFSHSRFYAKQLAALVTGMGREILLKTKDLVQNMNLEVIYGDTDSIMVNSNCTDIDQVYKLGNKIKVEVNKLYRLLEIDIDGVFKSMLLLKKKKYAALSVQKVGDKYITNKELKGLDIVRRDWSSLAKEAGNFVVDQILSGQSRESVVENIHAKLIDVGQKVRDGEVSTEMYHITKALTKNPEDYPDKKSLPHVQVAMRVNSRGGRKMRAGDTVFYVVCEDGSNLPASQRAYHPDELEKRDDLAIDTNYYLAHQIQPVVARLCDPIDGTDSAHIAECLGLDPSGYQRSKSYDNADNEEDAMLGVHVSDEERFQDCDRLKFRCPACNKEIIFDNVISGSGTLIDFSLEKCTNPDCKSRPVDNLGMMKNALTSIINKHIRTYYQGWMQCDDAVCGALTRRLPLVFSRGHPVCSSCKKGLLIPKMSDKALYDQLCYYSWLFDLEKALLKIKEPDEQNYAKRHVKDEIKEGYNKLKCHVDKRLQQSAYSDVDLAKLFWPCQLSLTLK